MLINPDKTTGDQLYTTKLPLKGLIQDTIGAAKSKRKTTLLTVILSRILRTDATKLATSRCELTCLLLADTDAAVAIPLETNPQCLHPVPAVSQLQFPLTTLSRQFLRASPRQTTLSWNRPFTETSAAPSSLRKWTSAVRSRCLCGAEMGSSRSAGVASNATTNGSPPARPTSKPPNATCAPPSAPQTRWTTTECALSLACR